MATTRVDTSSTVPEGTERSTTMSKNRSNTQSEVIVESPEAEVEQTEVPEEALKPLTPYEAHKFVNAALEEASLSKRIPPQMMYNYTSTPLNKGKKPLIKYSPAEGVDREDFFERFLPSYVAKQSAKAEAAAAEVEAEAEEPTEEVSEEVVDAEV